MIFIAILINLLLVFGSIIFIRSHRSPDRRSIIVGDFEGKRAIIFGVACVLFVLVTGFISDTFLGALIGELTALIGGFAVAATVSWFSERRGNSKEG